jgi:hypothetical protein
MLFRDLVEVGFRGELVQCDRFVAASKFFAGLGCDHEAETVPFVLPTSHIAVTGIADPLEGTQGCVFGEENKRVMGK